MDRMQRRIRRLRRAKWAMVVVSVVLGAMMVGSAFFWAKLGLLPTSLGGPRLLIYAGHGTMVVRWIPEGFPAPWTQFHFTAPGFQFTPFCFFGGHYAFGMPVIYPLFATIGAAWLLHRGEKSLESRARGCARCGYDLRGSAGEVCPECGTPKSVEAKGVSA